MILESDVESALRDRLHEYGFLVLKLYTPGHIGTMDRMILRPRYSPGPPMFLEVKRPKKNLRRLQAAIGEDWTRRGCRVLRPCTTLGEVDQLAAELIAEVAPDLAKRNSR